MTTGPIEITIELSAEQHEWLRHHKQGWQDNMPGSILAALAAEVPEWKELTIQVPAELRRLGFDHKIYGGGCSKTLTTYEAEALTAVYAALEIAGT